MTRKPHSLALAIAALVPAVTVVWSVDALTPVVVGTAVFVALVVAIRVPTVTLGRLVGLVILAAGASIASLLYAQTSGVVYVDWGFVTISDGSFQVGLAAFARIVAIGLPTVAIFPVVDVHELVATTVVRRVVPQRVALASLIALRLVPVIAADLDETRIARRAAGRSHGIRSLVTTTLVIAIRRAIRMSEIAEVRGFSSANRVWTSYRPFGVRDWVLVSVAVLSGVFALVVTAAVGEWNSAIG